MPGTDTAAWWRRAVCYQIYPRSFQDSNGDGIGDILGIISRLDYLNDGTPRSLGIDAIWLSPCYRSPMKDFGYDISDYTDIDLIFGNRDDFERLVSEAHRRGIKIILDLVINHTSDCHPWFVESRSSKDNPKRNWYLWHPGNNGRPPNNWFAGFELKSAWWRDERTGEYYLGTFTRHQPEVNWRNPDLRRAMYDVIRFWLDLGVDGFRMDVVNWYIKDARLRSNPWRLSLTPPDLQRHLYDRNQPETHAICQEIRKITDEYPERMLVGEIYCDDPQLAASYYGAAEDELHLAFNFAFLYQKWDARAFSRQIDLWENLLSGTRWPNYTLSNHDQPRHYYRYRCGKWDDARARVAAALLLTVRGTPFLYYGEEIGMTNGRIPRRQLQDPLGKRAWPLLKGRDGARTPMQWDSSAHSGFTTGHPWLPVNPDFGKVNVDNQLDDPLSLLSFYRRVIWLRKQTPALAIGSYQRLSQVPQQVLAYKRSHAGQEVVVILNFSQHKQRLNPVAVAGKPCFEVLFGTHRHPQEKVIGPTSVQLQPYEVLLGYIS